MQFTKMQESGNEYACVDNFSPPSPVDPMALGLELGGRLPSQVMVISRSEQADVRMDLFRADGSPMEGCGDGLRCLAKYVFDHGLVRTTRLSVESYQGLWYLNLETGSGLVDRVHIDMGQPILESGKIPTALPGNPPLEIPMTWPDTMVNVNCVRLAAPHAVVFVRDLTDQLVHGIGSQLETHTVFPHHTNVHFAIVNRRNDVTARSWGRDRGEIPSSSGGAGAVVVAGVLTGRTDPRLVVHMRGGTFPSTGPGTPKITFI